MNWKVLTIGAACALSLAACEQGKPRHVPPDPMAKAPPPVIPIPGAAQPVPLFQSLSAGLSKLPQAALFSIDSIGPAIDPLNQQPAVVPTGEPIVVRGFGLDPVTKTPGKGLDVVVDGKAYGTDYGAGRDDVAAYFKAAGLTKVGFKTTLPPGEVAVGRHQVLVRVVAADGKGYYDGPPIAFEVK
jgi:hypothetical protein